ncbi:MAG: hypothetical protein OXC31_16840 [Spirochaetaceae bacterium]|nr:hypothetical protein [Spirochaetaceae bacterium]
MKGSDLTDREWESYKALPRAGVSVAEWMEAYAAARERVWLVASDGQRVRVVHEAEAEAVSGIAVAGGDRPAWAWTFRSSGVWRNYVVRAQSIADDLPAGPLVVYSSPTYVRSGYEEYST